MNLRRTFAVTKRVFRDIKNDKRTIALMFIAPIFAMFVLDWPSMETLKTLTL